MILVLIIAIVMFIMMLVINSIVNRKLNEADGLGKVRKLREPEEIKGEEK